MNSGNDGEVSTDAAENANDETAASTQEHLIDILYYFPICPEPVQNIDKW